MRWECNSIQNKLKRHIYGVREVKSDMKVNIYIKGEDKPLTTCISQQTCDMIRACWESGETFKFGNGRIDGKDIRGIEVLEDGNEDV